MTSATKTRLHHSIVSPLESAQKALDSEISSRMIPQSDHIAPEGARDAIDRAMRANRPTEGRGGP